MGATTKRERATVRFRGNYGACPNRSVAPRYSETRNSRYVGRKWMRWDAKLAIVNKDSMLPSFCAEQQCLDGQRESDEVLFNLKEAKQLWLA